MGYDENRWKEQRAHRLGEAAFDFETIGIEKTWLLETREDERRRHHHDDGKNAVTRVVQHPLSTVRLLFLTVQCEEASLSDDRAIGYSPDMLPVVPSSLAFSESE